jgi:hypothetical protein
MISEYTVLPTIAVNLRIASRLDIKELKHRIGLVPLFVGASHCNSLFDCLTWDERDRLFCIRST